MPPKKAARKKTRRAPAKRKKTRRNPSLVVLGANPPKGAVLFGKSVEEIRYVHAEDGKRYRHPFERKDVKMYALANGDILIRCKGHRLHGDF